MAHTQSLTRAQGLKAMPVGQEGRVEIRTEDWRKLLILLGGISHDERVGSHIYFTVDPDARRLLAHRFNLTQAVRVPLPAAGVFPEAARIPLSYLGQALIPDPACERLRLITDPGTCVVYGLGRHGSSKTLLSEDLAAGWHLPEQVKSLDVEPIGSVALEIGEIAEPFLDILKKKRGHGRLTFRTEASSGNGGIDIDLETEKGTRRLARTSLTGECQGAWPDEVRLEAGAFLKSMRAIKEGGYAGRVRLAFGKGSYFSCVLSAPVAEPKLTYLQCESPW